MAPGMAGQGVHSLPMACLETASLQHAHKQQLQYRLNAACARAVERGAAETQHSKEQHSMQQDSMSVLHKRSTVQRSAAWDLSNAPARANLQPGPFGKQQGDGFKVAVGPSLPAGQRFKSTEVAWQQKSNAAGDDVAIDALSKAKALPKLKTPNAIHHILALLWDSRIG